MGPIPKTPISKRTHHLSEELLCLLSFNSSQSLCWASKSKNEYMLTIETGFPPSFMLYYYPTFLHFGFLSSKLWLLWDLPSLNFPFPNPIFSENLHGTIIYLVIYTKGSQSCKLLPLLNLPLSGSAVVLQRPISKTMASLFCF